MGIQVAGTQLQWSQLSSAITIIPSHATFAAVLLLRSANRRGTAAACGGDRASSSLFLSSGAGKLLRSRSVDNLRVRKKPCEERTLRRVVTACVEHFDDEDDPALVRSIEQLAIELLHQQGKGGDWMVDGGESSSSSQSSCAETTPAPPSVPSLKTHEPLRLPLQLEPPDWSDRIVSASVQRFSTSLDLPLSLRILKRKMRGEDSWFLEASESACCSMKRAFSSMLFIILELHSYTIQMREVVFYEDVRGIAGLVRHEMNSSFIWLFQQIFSCTPTLMVSLMLLLANFTVYSMRNTGPSMLVLNRPAQQSLLETVVVENISQGQRRWSSSKTFSSLGRAASFRGSGAGGGRRTSLLAGATGDELPKDGSSTYRALLQYGISTTLGTVNAEEVEGRRKSAEGGTMLAASLAEEARVWKGILEEAFRMQARTTDDALMDPDTRRNLVAPVSVELEPDESPHYLLTEITYHQALAQEPENPLLLTNYAQFIFLVLHDLDRAEYYFKKAVAAFPANADALSRYANFLWIARKDLETAEEIYLQAIDAEPDNAFHAANYANFLWNTGGEDTCYPLDADEQSE